MARRRARICSRRVEVLACSLCPTLRDPSPGVLQDKKDKARHNTQRESLKKKRYIESSFVVEV
jgi:hypothetical protein